MSFSTVDQIKRANRARGLYFFEPDTMRFFGSRLGQTVYGGRYFITSERREWNTPRCYTIREARPDGQVDTVGDFMAYETRAQAVAAVKRLLNGS